MNREYLDVYAAVMTTNIVWITGAASGVGAAVRVTT
jgi:NADP-dependent 3-hydroxy acid dehydrogenase YdfG